MFFDRNERLKALASFEEAGMRATRIRLAHLWIVKNEDLERGKRILRERKILGVHKPWD